MTRYSMGLPVVFRDKTNLSDVAHHTIWMGERYKALLHDIFNKKIPAEDFSLYLHRPLQQIKAVRTCTDVFMLCPVPNTRGIRTGTKKHLPCETVLSPRLIAPLCRVWRNPSHRFGMTPDDFTNDYRSMHGAGFSIVPVLPNPHGFAIITVIADR